MHDKSSDKYLPLLQLFLNWRLKLGGGFLLCGISDGCLNNLLFRCITFFLSGDLGVASFFLYNNRRSKLRNGAKEMFLNNLPADS